MTQATLPITPSQTIGPFAHEAWQWAVSASATIVPGGPAITISGTVLDGAGVPVDEAQIECWSPAASGTDAGEQGAALAGFRRTPTDAKGGFSFRLARPAPGQPAAHVTVFARGLLLHAFSAVFLEDDAGLAQSAILTQVPPERRATLVASRESNPGAPDQYRWDIHLQGERETAFFDYA
jgi:protocatechuate 3,4-dioxygenase alpha subunit